MFIVRKFYNEGAVTDNAGGSGVQKTNAEIDKQNLLRSQLGQKPLPYETTPAASAASPETIIDTRTPEEIAAAKTEEEAQKLVIARAAEIEAEQNAEKERLRLLALEEKGEETVKITKVAPAQPAAKTDDAPAEDDIDTDKLLKQLSKVAGREIKSLDDLKVPERQETPEELAEKQRQRESSKMEYALKNKIISTNEIESFIEDNKNKVEVAYNFYAESLKAVAPELTDKQIRERFEEAYSLNEDEESVEYKLGQKQLNFIADKQIAEKHSKYLSLENEYASFETAQTKEAQRKAAILQKAPQFKNDIKTVAERCKTLTVAGKKVEIGDDIIKDYLEEIYNSPEVENIIEKGYTLESLEQNFVNKIFLDNKDAITQKLIDNAVLKAQAGVRGIVPEKKTGQQKVYNELKGGEALKDLHERIGMTNS